MEFKEQLYVAGAALVALLIRVVKEQGKSARYYVYLILVAIFMSMFLAPAIAEKMNLSIKMTSLLSGFLVLFGATIVDVIDKKLPNKLEEKIDNI
jgi:hypothetical protein